MANPQKSYKNLKQILFFFIILSLSASSSARPLYTTLLQSLTATEAAMNILALIPKENIDDVSVSVSVSVSTPTIEKDSEYVLPCDMGLDNIGSARLADKFGPLILNMLPKGTIPPSGPSKGTNSVNN